MCVWDCWAPTVNGHEEQLLRLHDLEQLVQVVENFHNHLRLRQLGARIIAMRAVVDDAVHVQVQVVDLGDVGLRNGLVDQRIPLAQPPVELGDACSPTYTILLWKLHVKRGVQDSQHRDPRQCILIDVGMPAENAL